jgi:Trk K+ transport system NAD-binding subunit
MVEVPVGPSLVGKTLQELGVRRAYGITVVAVKRAGDQDVPEDAVEVAGPDTLLETGDVVLVIGRDEKVQGFEKAMSNERGAPAE